VRRAVEELIMLSRYVSFNFCLYNAILIYFSYPGCDELICITEDKQHRIPIGFAQVSSNINIH